MDVMAFTRKIQGYYSTREWERRDQEAEMAPDHIAVDTQGNLVRDCATPNDISGS
jgi:hypothetical protein